MMPSRGARGARTTSIVASFCAVVALAGCGGSDDASDTVAPSTTAPSTTAQPATTEAPADTAAATTNAAGSADVWQQTAAEHRGQNGERFTIDCPPGGTAFSIWGVETYTDDSSICTAAVHVGLATFDEGGTVEYEIAPGQDEYESAIGNDVLSDLYGPWAGSFVFPDAPPGTGTFTSGAETWNRTANDYTRDEGEQVTIGCAAGGPLGAVWGTDTYTSDSSVCTAAVHAGLITVDEGGEVTFELTPGADSYKGTTANGVTTQSYGSYSGSFVFADPQPD